MSDPSELSTDAFRDLMAQHGLQRAWFATHPTTFAVECSHPILEPLARRMEADTRDFERHEGIFLHTGPRTGILQAAFVHRTCRGQGAGGTRLWGYRTVWDFLVDGIRLSRGMTRKNALAGLWWGGGKGVIARRDDLDYGHRGTRDAIYADYGSLTTSIRGCYVTAEDVGTGVQDMAAVFSATRFTTCIPESLGGSGNPSHATARGVVCGMRAALHHLDLGDLTGKSVAIQGLGHVGTYLVQDLVEHGVGRIVATDLDPGRVHAVRERFGGQVQVEAEVSEPFDDRVLFAEVDVVAPAATGAVLNPDTIPKIRAPIVCGPANNQLADPMRDDALLAAQGILYMPDFLVNRMGIVNCADEQYGHVDDDPHFTRHLGTTWPGGVYRRSLRILECAADEGCTPAHMARQEADRLATELHPLWGHRGQRIVRSVVQSDWAEGP